MPCALLRDASRAGDLVTANPVLAVAEHPKRSEPYIQSQRRILENRSHLHGKLLSARIALPPLLIVQPVVLAVRRVALRAGDPSIRPAESRYSVDAGLRIFVMADGLSERARYLHTNTVYLLGQVVKKILDFFLGQVYRHFMTTKEPFRLTSEAAKKLSELGASKGGEVRAQKLSADRRREIAQAAVQARWEKAGKGPLLRATHKGSFKEEFGIDAECYVLADEAHTAVISQRGMAQALGFSRQGGGRLPRFLGGKNIAPYIGLELREKLEQPVIFQWSAAVSGPRVTVYGFDVTLLIDVCKAIVAAEANGHLSANQRDIAKQAHVILNASAKAGIKGLVYALAGYDATKEEIIASFKMYVREEAREYEKEFPDQLYEEWYRLYNLPKPERNKPWKFMHLTVDQVYKPLAKSSGKIFQLTREQRDNSNVRWKKLHQFLSEVGVKALRTHLGQLLGIARISKSEAEYEGHVRALFGDQYEIHFPGGDGSR